MEWRAVIPRSRESRANCKGEDAMTSPSSPSLNASRESRAQTSSGYLMLAIMLGVVALGLVLVLSPARSGATFVIIVLCVLAFLLISKGFYMLQPNQAAVVTMFGSYMGSDRATGLRWVWPWMGKHKLSLRANNVISEALFDVDDYKAFVSVQIEAAVRTIGSRYPYDDYEHQEVTLRGNNDQVRSELRAELINRLQVAGITVDECNFTHLAYASEIAGAMLRRQQAQAVVAARKALVEGAVGMVEMALDMLATKKLVELDVDRRASLVSNLMVVLCSERDTQPIVNAGTPPQ
jgi:regulator of protease activity HflC (stomatin/prohibitin superfamily)